MIKKTVFDKVHIIHNLFSKQELSEIRLALEQVKWQEDQNGNHVVQVESVDSSIFPHVIDVYNSKVSILKSEIEKDFSYSVGNENHSAVVRYREGWALHSHVDSWSNLKTFSGYPSRDVSSLIYLTDDFKGGKLVFNELKIEIEPIAGSAVYFPSDEKHIHKVTELISGNRWVSTCFWHLIKE
jgi:predicted 2-oxoglutarate/Fe(II)-dependent dioxygenase YbiX